MAEQIVVKVKTVSVEEKVSSKTNKPYKMIRITDDTDTSFGGFLNKSDHLPVEGELVELTVQPVTKNDTTYNNIQKISQVDTTERSTKKRTTSNLKKSEGSTSSSTRGLVSGMSTEITGVPSKDISMEVSGLLQAIITKHGLSSDTETLLRDALKLKRRVASELESNGAV